jgi:hypothetical protein
LVAINLSSAVPTAAVALLLRAERKITLVATNPRTTRIWATAIWPYQSHAPVPAQKIAVHIRLRVAMIWNL